MLSCVTIAQEKRSFTIRNEKHVLSSLELALNIGTTGLGIELASPVTDWVKVRAGFDFMPHLNRHINFKVENYIGYEMADNFDRINEMMANQTGYSINRNIRMETKPTMETFRLLVDIYPFKSYRHWHITAGFFLGKNSIGSTINTRAEMPSLMGIKMYHSLYENVTSEDFIRDPQDYPLFGILTFEKETAVKFQKKMYSAGKLGIHAGDYRNGVPCILYPNEEGILQLKTKINVFRPYVGFGYASNITKDGKWQAAFDLGVQFWGGTPKLTASDGTIINNLTNLSKETKSYIDLMNALPVYPTIGIRISYRF